MKPELLCGQCKGKGRIPLPDWLAETLAMVPRRGAVTTFDLHARNKNVAPTAFNNRLERLRELGFVTRTRAGKFWRYSRA